MGVQISNILPRKEIELCELSNRKIAIDAFNTLFQFLSIIRQRDTGELLRDSKGRITSHLSGLFYRTAKLMEVGIKPVYVFDGEPPKLKKALVREREEARERSRDMWKKAVEEGRKEDVMVYAQGSAKLTDDMIEESKKLLDALGVPCLQAPSEGEAQASYLVKKGDVYAVGSQDADSLLFGSERLVRNLSITGRRKMPRQQKWIEIKPEIINLSAVLEELNLTRDQLVIVGILIGTDYNPDGVKEIGPKKALALVHERKTLENVLKEVKWEADADPYEVYKLFLNPIVLKKYKIEWGELDEDKTRKLLVDEHDFSLERVDNVLGKLLDVKKKGTQVSLDSWLR